MKARPETLKAKHAVWVLVIFAALLLLASTKFSVVSWIWAKSAWTWQYFQYSYGNGWGYPYQSDYSLAVVLTYVAAFVAGIIGYLIAGKRVAGRWSVAAVILCVLGLVSFLIEASHWLWEHHLSWIAICPAASLVLAAIAIVQLGKSPQPSIGAKPPSAAPPHSA